MTTADASPARTGSDTGLGVAWDGVRSRFSGPTASFHLVIGFTVLLLGIGLMMVQSSSSVRAFADSADPYFYLIRQSIYMVVGLVAFYVAMRMRFSTLLKLVNPLLAVSTLLLIAVLIPGIGSEVNGSRGWISFGAFAVQPAEIGRLAVILWVAAVLAPRVRTATVKGLLWPALLAPAVIGALTLIAPDLGMATSVGIAFVILIYLAGFPGWKLFGFLGGAAVVFGVAASMMAYRMSRIQVYVDTLRGNFDRAGAAGYQSYQGLLSLADGGLFGRGLGQSSAKWYYLPEASNDFIFAIIGEELGWLGALGVVALYAGIAWVGIRIAARSVDPFRRLVAGTVSTTIALQAFINIGYVVGLLPVTGIQLPLISYGGSSAVITLASLGLLANCARHEPEAISDYHSRISGRRRWWSLPEPVPYSPEPLLRKSAKPGRSSTGSSRFGEPVTSPRARYESVPVVREDQSNRTMMTGRTSRPAREERRRHAEATAPRGAARPAPRRAQLRSVPSPETPRPAPQRAPREAAQPDRRTRGRR